MLDVYSLVIPQVLNTRSLIDTALPAALDSLMAFDFINSSDRALIESGVSALRSATSVAEARDSIFALKTRWAGITWSGYGYGSGMFLDVADSSLSYWAPLLPPSRTAIKNHTPLFLGLLFLGVCADAAGGTLGMMIAQQGTKEIKGRNASAEEVRTGFLIGAGAASGGVFGGYGGAAFGIEVGKAFDRWLRKQ